MTIKSLMTSLLAGFLVSAQVFSQSFPEGITNKDVEVKIQWEYPVSEALTNVSAFRVYYNDNPTNFASPNTLQIAHFQFSTNIIKEVKTTDGIKYYIFNSSFRMKPQLAYLYMVAVGIYGLESAPNTSEVLFMPNSPKIGELKKKSVK